jgi:hypothetical protein
MAFSYSKKLVFQVLERSRRFLEGGDRDGQELAGLAVIPKPLDSLDS